MRPARKSPIKIVLLSCTSWIPLLLCRYVVLQTLLQGRGYFPATLVSVLRNPCYVPLQHFLSDEVAVVIVRKNLRTNLLELGSKETEFSCMGMSIASRVSP